MKKIINTMLLGLRYILYLGAFAISFYIVLSMYNRLGKNMMESINIFIPYAILLIIFFINIIFRQKSVNNNLFYNLTCCLIFATTIVVGIRAICDTNMILNKVMGYNINFIYFSDYISFMKLLIYGLCISNILFMICIKEKIVQSKNNIEVL